MGLTYANLDARTRALMVAELKADIASMTIYESPRLTDAGRAAWPLLLEEAATTQDDDWLAIQLKARRLLRAYEQQSRRQGRVTVAVPYNAPETLAEGEFNRFYIRGVCRRAIEDGIPFVSVYRAKVVENPRASSEGRLGAQVSADALLRDLRANPGVDTALGLPNGPNSGLSVRLPTT